LNIEGRVAAKSRGRDAQPIPACGGAGRRSRGEACHRAGYIHNLRQWARSVKGHRESQGILVLERLGLNRSGEYENQRRKILDHHKTPLLSDIVKKRTARRPEPFMLKKSRG
jgi:hypothetical protein